MENNIQSLSVREEKKKLIKELLPDAFLDDILQFSYFKEIFRNEFIDEDVHQNQYGLFWPGKNQAIQSSKTFSKKTLAPLLGKGIKEEKTKNFFIEGENLDVLKLLQKSYQQKIKLIYIDPPYNTGNDFIYNDKFSEGKKEYLKKINQLDKNAKLPCSQAKLNGRLHSNWLSMMYPRLEVAKNLLREDGIICISIDDNEIHNIRHLLDEIFGHENFCGVIKRKASRKSAFLSKKMSDLCDYIVIYSKGNLSSALSVNQISESTRPVFNEGNKTSVRIIPKGTSANCPDGHYKAGDYTVRTLNFTLLNDLNIKKGVSLNAVDVIGQWRVNQKIVNESIFITKNLGFRRRVLQEELQKKKVLSDILDLPECYNEKGSEELKELFNNDKGIFDNPKPIGLMQYIFKASGIQENDYVLDFFAGSASTFHASLKENSIKENSFFSISVQMPELILGSQNKFKTISEISIERMRRAIKKIHSEITENVAKKIDLGFKCFKLKDSNLNFSSTNDGLLKDFISDDYRITLAENFIPEEVIWEIILHEGFPLHSLVHKEVGILENNIFKITSDWKDNTLLICLDSKIEINTIQKLLKLKEKNKDFNLLLRKSSFDNFDMSDKLFKQFKVKLL